MLSQLGQIAFNVDDLERAVKFYRDTLQVPFLFEFPGLAFFDCAGVRLMLSTPEGGEVHGRGSVLYFKVADIHAEAQSLMSRNVTFEQAPHLVAKLPDHDLWIGFFRDPDGNLLALMSEVRGAS
jgi:catechol 2,3-dioxygenase-like lactoylglutathione lyase family enzyme